MITGPSAAGKTHLVHEMVTLDVHPLETYTDRERRPTEKQNTDRVYLSKQDFTHSLEEFLYWFKFQGNRYGYKSEDLYRQLKANNPVCFNIPPAHLKNILMQIPDAIVIYLFVNKKNFPLLKERMIKRDIKNTDNPRIRDRKIKNIEKRLDHALNEMKNVLEYKKLLSQNINSKLFYIESDETLYAEVLPHIKKILKHR